MVIAGVLLLPGCQRDGNRSADLGTLEITVSEAGAVRRATMFCGRQNAGSGYLEPGYATTAACVTAVVNPRAVAYLERGRLPRGSDCGTSVPPALKGATAELSGRWKEKKTKRSLVVKTPCDARLWQQLLPLLQPEREPVVEQE